MAAHDTLVLPRSSRPMVRLPHSIHRFLPNRSLLTCASSLLLRCVRWLLLRHFCLCMCVDLCLVALLRASFAVLSLCVSCCGLVGPLSASTFASIVFCGMRLCHLSLTTVDGLCGRKSLFPGWSACNTVRYGSSSVPILCFKFSDFLFKVVWKLEETENGEH